METNITARDFESWWGDHWPSLRVPSSVYTDELRSAIFYFKKHDPDFRGTLPRADFREMCLEMGWSEADTAKSLDLLESDGDGRVSLDHYLQWYTDDGLVANVLTSFDIDKDRQLNYAEFDRLCLEVNSKLAPAEVSWLFRKYNCAVGTAATDDEPLATWLPKLGYANYLLLLEAEGFDTVGSLRAASLTGPELKEIGVAKLRHRKDLLRSLNTEGFVRAGDLRLLFARIRDEKRSREALRCVKHGMLDFLGDESEQFRDGNVWQ